MDTGIQGQRAQRQRDTAQHHMGGFVTDVMLAMTVTRGLCRFHHSSPTSLSELAIDRTMNRHGFRPPPSLKESVPARENCSRWRQVQFETSRCKELIQNLFSSC